MNIFDPTIYPFHTLEAVYSGHGRRKAALKRTLQTLEVTAWEIRALEILGWRHMADRVARERARQELSVHTWGSVMEVLRACTDRGGTGSCFRNMIMALRSLSVDLLTIDHLVRHSERMVMLADRVALEVERLGKKAEYQAILQARQQGAYATLPASMAPR